MKNKTFTFISFVLSIVLSLSVLYKYHIQLYSELGVSAVNYMYNFNSLEELDYNLQRLQSITTPEVYRQLDINYDTRVIGVYYKFQADPAEVEIINSTPNSVCYRIKSEHVDYSRIFLFRYIVKNNKISEVQEYEIVKGIDDYGGVVYE